MDSNSKHYNAPWSTSLILVSSLATLLCSGISIGMIVRGPGVVRWLSLVPLLIVAGSALFTIRGYTAASDAILIHRLFWTTRLPLTDLQDARCEPNAMRRSIRTFGNGGLFSFSGLFYNKALGSYRAFVTDPGRTVVLTFSKRTVVVSPSGPEGFVQEVSNLIQRF